MLIHIDSYPIIETHQWPSLEKIGLAEGLEILILDEETVRDGWRDGRRLSVILIPFEVLNINSDAWTCRKPMQLNIDSDMPLMIDFMIKVGSRDHHHK